MYKAKCGCNTSTSTKGDKGDAGLIGPIGLTGTQGLTGPVGPASSIISSYLPIISSDVVLRDVLVYIQLPVTIAGTYIVDVELWLTNTTTNAVTCFTALSKNSSVSTTGSNINANHSTFPIQIGENKVHRHRASIILLSTDIVGFGIDITVGGVLLNGSLTILKIA